MTRWMSMVCLHHARVRTVQCPLGGHVFFNLARYKHACLFGKPPRLQFAIVSSSFPISLHPLSSSSLLFFFTPQNLNPLYLLLLPLVPSNCSSPLCLLQVLVIIVTSEETRLSSSVSPFHNHHFWITLSSFVTPSRAKSRCHRAASVLALKCDS